MGFLKPNQKSLKLGALTKFCCVIGFWILASCDGLTPNKETNGREQPSDIDFSKLDPSKVSVALKPTCDLEEHTDPNKRNLVCDIKTVDDKEVFTNINAAEVFILYENGDKNYLPVSLVRKGNGWQLKAEFDVSRITEIKSMTLGVDQNGTPEFYEFKFSYEDKIVFLSVSGSGESNPEESGSISSISEGGSAIPVLSFGKQAIREWATKYITLTAQGPIPAKITAVEVAAYDNDNWTLPVFTDTFPNACGMTIEESCKIRFRFRPEQFENYSIDLNITYDNGLSKSKIKIRVNGEGGMVPTFVLGQADFISGDPDSAVGRLDTPTGVFFDGVELFVADKGNSRIQKWASIGAGQSLAGSELITGIPNVSKIIKVGSSLKASINKASAMGGGIATYDWNSGSGFYEQTSFTSSNFPFGIFSAASKLFWTSKQFNSVFIDGVQVSDSGAVQAPVAVFSRDGSKYFVADSDNNRIAIWNSTPAALTSVPDKTIGDQSGMVTSKTLFKPNDIVVSNDDIFVADTNNNRILRFKVASLNDTWPSAVEVFGQNTMTEGSANLTASKFRINQPSGLHVANRKLFVADTVFNRILVIPIPE